MAATVEGAIRELMEQTMVTMSALLAASDRELPMPSSHPCAQGKDVWTLLTNDVDHEKIHTGQILEARYESRITAAPMQRLVAEWIVERARFIGSFIGPRRERKYRERQSLHGSFPPTNAGLQAGSAADEGRSRGRTRT
jgi:hypothetical protein